MAWAVSGPTVRGGGGPQNVLIVVNDNSLESLELGQYYRQKRGIPEKNIFHVRTSPTNFNISTVAFTNEIRKPVLDYLAASGLSNQIDYIVFSRNIPYRVYLEPYSDKRHSGLTASMFYDFKSSPDAFVYGCDLAAGSASAYYEAERAFAHAGPPSSNRYYLATILTSTNFANTKILVDRSVEADYTQPSGTVHFFHTLDFRNVQWKQFENADFTARFLNVPQQRAIIEGLFTNALTNALGVMVGRAAGNDILNSTFAKGAIGEHVTSYGGYLFENSGQQSIIDWPHAGCVASYGTIVEPCEYTNKFPNPRAHFWYARGFSMGESYWMSVQNPYQGVFVGDPLCAPYAVAPAAALYGVTNQQVVSGPLPIAVTGTAAAALRPLDQVDLFLDGQFLATVAAIPPRPSNVVTVTINSTNCTYAAPAGASLFTVATGIAARINASNLGVVARASGDRIAVRQNAIGVPGTSLTCTAGTSIGVATELTVWAVSPFTNFLPSTYCAYEQLTLSGVPVSGDVLRVTVTNLSGVTVTNEAVAMPEDDRNTLLNKLASVVNSNTALAGSDGCEMKWVTVTTIYENASTHEAYLVARTNTWEGALLHANYEVVKQPGSTLVGPGFDDYFNDNDDVLSARATVFLAAGRTNLSAAYTLSTTNLPDGPHTLTAVAYEGTAVKCQGRVSVSFIVDNNKSTCNITNPLAGATFLLGEDIPVHVYAAPEIGTSITGVDLFAEGKWVASTGAPPYAFQVPCTNYGVGQLTLQAKAWPTNSTPVLSTNCVVTILPDYDFDGLDDNWEIVNFGSITNWTGLDDPDTDGADNHNEYIADTEPTNLFHYFRVQIFALTTDSVPRLDFISSSARQYFVTFNDLALTNDLYWFDGSNRFWGALGTSTWFDNGADGPVSTNSLRFYRVGAVRP